MGDPLYHASAGPPPIEPAREPLWRKRIDRRMLRLCANRPIEPVVELPSKPMRAAIVTLLFLLLAAVASAQDEPRMEPAEEPYASLPLYAAMDDGGRSYFYGVDGETAARSYKVLVLFADREFALGVRAAWLVQNGLVRTGTRATGPVNTEVAVNRFSCRLVSQEFPPVQVVEWWGNPVPPEVR